MKTPVKLTNNVTQRLLIIVTCVLTAAAQNKRPARDAGQQMSFGSETPIKRPVKLPAPILERVARDNAAELKNCVETDGGGGTDVSKYFVASMIRMDSDEQADVIVQPDAYCLQGAHNTVFWIFTKLAGEPATYRLTFNERADFLDILKTTSHGHRDVRTASYTATTMYRTTWRYDGRGEYEPKVCTQENLETNKAVRISCKSD